MWCSSQAAGFSTSGTLPTRSSLMRTLCTDRDPNDRPARPGTRPLTPRGVMLCGMSVGPGQPVAARRHPGPASRGRAGRHRLPRPRLAAGGLPRRRRLLRRVGLRHHRGAAARARAHGPHLPARLLGAPRAPHPAARPRRHRRGRRRRARGLGGRQGGRRARRRDLRHVLRRQLALRGGGRRLLRSWAPSRRRCSTTGRSASRSSSTSSGRCSSCSLSPSPVRTHRHRAALAVLAAAVGIPSLVWAVVQTTSDPTTPTTPRSPAAGSSRSARPSPPSRPEPAGMPSGWLPPPERHCRGPVSPSSSATCLMLSPDTGVPYPAALGATVGTALVLLAGIGARPRFGGSVLLTNPVSGYLGDISFGLYLWHFPLVVLVPVFLSPADGPASPWCSPARCCSPSSRTTSRAARARRPAGAPTGHARVRPGARHARRRGRRRRVGAARPLQRVDASPRPPRRPRPRCRPPRRVVARGRCPPRPARCRPIDHAQPPDEHPGTDPHGRRPPRPLRRGPRSPWAPPAPGCRTACARPSPRPRGPPTSTRHPTSGRPPPDQRKAMSACTATDAEDPDSCTFGNRKGPEIIVFGDSIGFPLLATVEKAYGSDVQGARHDQDRLRGQRRRRRLRQGRVGGPLRQPPADGARLRAAGEAEGPHHDRDLLVGGAPQLGCQGLGVGQGMARRRPGVRRLGAAQRRLGRHRRPVDAGRRVPRLLPAGRLSAAVRHRHTDVVGADPRRGEEGRGRDVHRHDPLVLRRRPLPDLHRARPGRSSRATTSTPRCSTRVSSLPTSPTS